MIVARIHDAIEDLWKSGQFRACLVAVLAYVRLGDVCLGKFDDFDSKDKIALAEFAKRLYQQYVSEAKMLPARLHRWGPDGVLCRWIERCLIPELEKLNKRKRYNFNAVILAQRR